MPWPDPNPMNIRTEFALKALTTANFRELCREYEISAKTGYKWHRRLLEHGVGGLQEESRRPKQSPEALDESTVCRIVRLKERHRHWGPRKLRVLYERQWAQAPSESSFKRVLERAGMVEKRRVRPTAQTGRIATGAKASGSNDVWTVDFKGWWHDGNGRSNPLTVRDEYSRYLLELRHLDEASTTRVQTCFERLFEGHGLPGRIRSDNGPPFASAQGLLGLSRLSAWWLALGIDLERSRPACPQDNGGHERLHGDVARELQRSGMHGARQEAFEVWRREFNTERPHEALGMRCPAEVYQRSERPWTGTPQGLEYEGMEVRRISKSGALSYEGSRYQISQALCGWEVGIKASTRQGQWEIYFCRLLLGHLEPQTGAFLRGQGVTGRIETESPQEPPSSQKSEPEGENALPDGACAPGAPTRSATPRRGRAPLRAGPVGDHPSVPLTHP